MQWIVALAEIAETIFRTEQKTKARYGLSEDSVSAACICEDTADRVLPCGRSILLC